MMKRKCDTSDDLANCFMLVVILLGVFFLVRTFSIFPSLTVNDLCELEYGEKWDYDHTINFGDTCVELDYINLDIVNRTDLNKSHLYNKYCEIPGFWEFDKWGDKCLK